MTPYWITFIDGTKACCEGQGPYDAKVIAEHVSGKKVQPKVAEPSGWNGADYCIEPLPYPASPALWQHDHPVHGKCPTFCYTPAQCAGKTHCHRDPACTE